MKIPWPPSEQTGWLIETYKEKTTRFFFPPQKHNHPLFAFRINHMTEVTVSACTQTKFIIKANVNEWTMFPYLIEAHAIGPVWESMEIGLSNGTVELAYYPWQSRMFRMRVLTDEDENMVIAYRVNKNGQTIASTSYQNKPLVLAEDAYVIPPTDLINEKSIILVSSQTTIPTKKMPESRYFNL